MRISQETLLIMQNAIERLVRGFFEYFADHGKDTVNYSYRLFDQCLNQVLGQPGNLEFPYTSVNRT
jgi:hypothetical protein